MPTDAERLVEDTIALAEAVRDRSEYILRTEQENRSFQRALAAVVPPFDGETTEDWAERAFAGSSDPATLPYLSSLEHQIRVLKTDNRELRNQNVDLVSQNNLLKIETERLKTEIRRLEGEVSRFHGWDRPSFRL